MTGHRALAGQAARELDRRYDLDQRLFRVRRLLETPRQDRAKILRSHVGDPIRGADIWKRDNVDEVLAAISLLYIAGATKELDASYGFERVGVIKEFLNDPAAIRYYEQYYPVAIPVLLREELSGQLRHRFLDALEIERENVQWDTCFRRFLALDGVFAGTKPLNDFLSLLDDYSIRGLWFSDLRTALKDTSELKHWLRSKKRRPFLEGIDDFFEFSNELEQLLIDMESMPFSRGLIWLHFSYWYGAGGDRMRRVARWLVRLENTKIAHGEVQLSRTAALMGRLTSTLYAEPVLVACGDALARWKRYALPQARSVSDT